jgi:trans-aconitate 2-methyltransferase
VPAQYDRFARERRQPWDDLLGLVHAVPGGAVVDLGCGTGRLTQELPDLLRARTVIGVDRSGAMLAEASAHTRPGIEFQTGDLSHYTPAEPVDVIVANASLQWVDHHDLVLAGWRRALRPGGQIAVQVPANGDHPANATVVELSQDLADWFPDGPPRLVTDSVLAPERYASLLWDLDAVDQWVGLRVYAHELASTADVVEWLKGTTLNRVREALADDDRYQAFVDQLTSAVLDRLGDQSPFLYTFKRILFWARFD